jgi:hypothetical protein
MKPVPQPITGYLPAFGKIRHNRQALAKPHQTVKYLCSNISSIHIGNQGRVKGRDVCIQAIIYMVFQAG